MQVPSLCGLVQHDPSPLLASGLQGLKYGVELEEFRVLWAVVNLCFRVPPTYYKKQNKNEYSLLFSIKHSEVIFLVGV